MKFIGHSPSSTNFQANILTDGQLACTYQEIPIVFEHVHQWFAGRDIRGQDGIVLECENTVPCALVLLFLLEYDYDFLLIPRIRLSAQTSRPLPLLPAFCKYKLSPEIVGAHSSITEVSPADYLNLVSNDRWQSECVPPHTTAQFYLRTSGSTGDPKMTIHPHAKMVENARHCVERLGLQSQDRIALPAPIFHMFGYGAGFLPAVAVGAAIDLQKGANLLRYMQREREFNPNVAFMTPIFCETLLKGRKSPRPYRLTVSAGDRFRGDVFARYEALFGCLVNLYGSTEMGAMAASYPSDPLELRSTTVGLPMTGVRMRLEREPVSAAEDQQTIGQLWCQHDSGCEGYIDNSGQAVGWNSADHDGWFCTRDLGQMNSDGRVVVFGRSDHSVNRDGLLVFFADVEKALEKIEGVDAAVVVSKGEGQRGKGLVAYCVTAKDASLSEAEIRAAGLMHLPRRAVPDAIVMTKSLPLLPNGKVDRQQLSRLELNHEKGESV
jgi:acyl-coenzyme A synthetase/AMP-(fatty) acid ligase